MPLPDEPRHLPRLLGALVVVCLVLQRLVLPLHLLDHDHSFHSGEDHRGCAHVDHGHDHGEEHDHEEHPITEHLDQLADPTWNQVLAVVALHLDVREVAIEPVVALPRADLGVSSAAPRPPPPRPGPGLRAPPARV